ncbi:MAG: hypothetical protein ABL882_03140 [Sphingopyxis sp.]
MAEELPQVPPVDAQPIGPVEPNGRSDYEYRLLEADAKARENLNREADQRYWLRWVAVALVILIIFGMGGLLTHVAHWLPSEPRAMGAVIALHLAPIISMSTLAIALLVAAFRGFKDGDEKSGAAIATEGARATGFTN